MQLTNNPVLNKHMLYIALHARSVEPIDVLLYTIINESEGVSTLHEIDVELVNIPFIIAE